MLEQRSYSKFFTTDNANVVESQGAISISFLSGTTDADRAAVYLTASSPTSFNAKDSGIYDGNYRSGQPFFDDQTGLT